EDVGGGGGDGGGEGGAGRRREGEVDRLGDERLGGSVHVAELDVFGREARLLEKLAGLEHRAESDREAAGPITDLDLLLCGRRRGGKHERERQRRQQSLARRHRMTSSDGGCPSMERRRPISATASPAPMRG